MPLTLGLLPEEQRAVEEAAKRLTNLRRIDLKQKSQHFAWFVIEEKNALCSRRSLMDNFEDEVEHLMFIITGAISPQLTSSWNSEERRAHSVRIRLCLRFIRNLKSWCLAARMAYRDSRAEAPSSSNPHTSIEEFEYPKNGWQERDALENALYAIEHLSSVEYIHPDWIGFTLINMDNAHDESSEESSSNDDDDSDDDSSDDDSSDDDSIIAAAIYGSTLERDIEEERWREEMLNEDDSSEDEEPVGRSIGGIPSIPPDIVIDTGDESDENPTDWDDMDEEALNRMLDDPALEYSDAEDSMPELLSLDGSDDESNFGFDEGSDEDEEDTLPMPPFLRVLNIGEQDGGDGDTDSESDEDMWDMPNAETGPGEFDGGEFRM